jgi:mannose-6-phosphate isomerase-like protein (cupin superfamily)
MTDRMKNLIVAAMIAGLGGGIGVGAQQPAAAAPAAAMKLFASSADVAALIAKAKAERRPDQALLSQPIVGFAPYAANLEYRALVGGAAAHETELELFYVVDGAGTLVTGGTLTMETRPNANNRAGTGIQGGDSRRVAKGDFMLVPPGVPHWFSAIDGTLVLMSVHLPASR